MSRIYFGNCLRIMKKIKDKSIDMILCDLPYGMTARNKWDSIIPFKPLWKQYERIIKDNGAIVLTSIQPFTSKVVMSNINIFKYEWVWKKQQGTGFLNAKKQPLRNHENILVFYKKQCLYNPQFTKGKPYLKTKNGKKHSKNYGKQITVITKSNGKRYPKTIRMFKYDKQKFHPTQKPVKLFEYLIKTYTNKGEIILDNCCGSGTSGIAAMNLKRKFILIDNEIKYYNMTRKRLIKNKKRLKKLKN